MKIKQQPGDFQVEELTDIVPSESGPFAFYRLDKKGWTTTDAMQAIRRRWKIDGRRIAYGGLKDRHAQTSQHFTIFHGPRRGLQHHQVTVTYLGQVGAPFHSSDIRANRFQLVMRDLGARGIAFAQKSLEEVRRDGVPNYFDDQRFGSVSGATGTSGTSCQLVPQFVAKSMVLGRYEEALRLALAAPYEYDRATQKKEKAILQSHWGDWATLKQKLPRGHARSLVDFLVTHPDDFRGALVRLRPELRGLYLSAYQSHLWNQMLACWLRQHCRPEQLLSVKLRLGDLPMHRELDEQRRAEFAELKLPLPAARPPLDVSDPRSKLVQEVLGREGIQQEQLKLRGFREMFFSKGERLALSIPAGLQYEDSADERHSGRQKLTLRFDLSRGSYATLIVKRITAR